MRSWRSQIANGRVFELRSTSKRYPAPCGLIINEGASWRGERFMAGIDEAGVIGHGLYTRPHNPNIYVEGIGVDQFTGKCIVRRRPDLERFDADDLALIRWGCALDFNGRIHGSNHDTSIPLTCPAEWTVFWTQPYTEGFPYLTPTEKERKVLYGAWHFSNHGGPRHLGYKYGHMHATRHAGKHLDRVRKIILRHLPEAIETQVHVIRYNDKLGRTCITSEYEGDCAAFGDGRTTIVETSDGSMICCGPRRGAV